MKIRKLTMGRLEITASVPRWIQRPSKYDDGMENDKPELPCFHSSKTAHFSRRDVRENDEGCVAVGEDVSPDALRRGDDEVKVTLYDDPDGIYGNSDPAIARLHGWRGTTNDWHVSAWGWRRVESIKEYRDGFGWRIVLSKDLRPDEE